MAESLAALASAQHTEADMVDPNDEDHEEELDELHDERELGEAGA